MIPIREILLIVAFVCFIVAVFQAMFPPPREGRVPRINLVAFGLALWVLTLVLDYSARVR